MKGDGENWYWRGSQCRIVNLLNGKCQVRPCQNDTIDSVGWGCTDCAVSLTLWWLYIDWGIITNKAKHVDCRCFTILLNLDTDQQGSFNKQDLKVFWIRIARVKRCVGFKCIEILWIFSRNKMQIVFLSHIYSCTCLLPKLWAFFI